MRIAALIIGILGAVAGLIGAIVVLAVGGIGVVLEAEGGGEVVGLGFGALLMSVIGLVGATLAISKPKLAATLMAVSAIVGLVLIFVGYILATVLLLIAALLAFLGRHSETDTPSDG